VGPALGQRGLNIMEFCKAFNAATQKVEPGLPIPVIITAYSDRSFTFIMKTPPASILLKKAAGIESGSKRPEHRESGQGHAQATRRNRQRPRWPTSRRPIWMLRCAPSPAARAAWVW